MLDFTVKWNDTRMNDLIDIRIAVRYEKKAR